MRTASLQHFHKRGGTSCTGTNMTCRQGSRPTTTGERSDLRRQITRSIINARLFAETHLEVTLDVQRRTEGRIHRSLQTRGPLARRFPASTVFPAMSAMCLLIHCDGIIRLARNDVEVAKLATSTLCRVFNSARDRCLYPSSAFLTSRSKGLGYFDKLAEYLGF